MSPPRELKTGTWEVDVISTRVVVNLDGTEDEQSFNKTFTLKATDKSEPFANELQQSSDFQKRVNQIRTSGVEIIKIADYQS